ncbi:MAG TPA: MFS transporter [Candidatus Sulfotelmatobacter sp.]|nr:MFS transporter [Candidatus Sulfotelmatobacter sp.]
MSEQILSENQSAKAGYNRFLLFVAGLGGLLFGIDVGIVSGALPYLEDTFKDAATNTTLTSNQTSFIVAAFYLGGVFSTLFAGMLSDLLGRKTMMVFSGILFSISVPIIALSHSYNALILGRILQGCSGGLMGISVPLYLAECLSAGTRGKGTGVFQWLLTLGIFAAAIIGFVFSGKVDAVAKLGDAQRLFALKDAAWRGIFWATLAPGIVFVLLAFMVSESPRWLFRKGKKDAARTALLRSRTESQAEIELREMEETAAADKNKSSQALANDSLFQRKYILPFVLACIILACNQATGINSVIGYNTTIFIQAGLGDYGAHVGGVIQTGVNFLATIVAIALVDKRGRKFLLSLGRAGVIISMLAVGMVFKKAEAQRVDVKDFVQTMVVATNQTAQITFDGITEAMNRTALQPVKTDSRPCTLVVIYSYGDFRAASKVIRSDDTNSSISIERASCVPAGTSALTKIATTIQHPFSDLGKSRTAPLKIEHAIITPVPSEANGWLTAILIYCFMASFAVGPGVCVWLALSELMPTRIRSNGMSFALLINIAISTTIAAMFLPTVGEYGYSAMFFVFAGCTVVYFVTATFFLPETKGKTLEEIEEHFEGKHR